MNTNHTVKTLILTPTQYDYMYTLVHSTLEIEEDTLQYPEGDNNRCPQETIDFLKTLLETFKK